MYSLPKVIGDRYVLTSVLRDLPTTVMFIGVQNDIRREVVIEALRPELATEEHVEMFLETARAQSRNNYDFVSKVFEIIHVDNRWYLVRERLKGVPLNVLEAMGHRLEPRQLYGLLRQYLRCIIYMSIMQIASRPMDLESLYMSDDGFFRCGNPAIGGPRTLEMAEGDVRALGELGLQMVDEESEGASDLMQLCLRMKNLRDGHPASCLFFCEEIGLMCDAPSRDEDGEYCPVI